MKVFVTIKDKGGKIRTVPINECIAIAMREQLNRTQRGHKLLVPDNLPTGKAIQQLQQFILRHRETPLTFHGLRHTYAAETYERLLSEGMGKQDTHFAVSRLLGHKRADVTNIYLASLQKYCDRDG